MGQIIHIPNTCMSVCPSVCVCVCVCVSVCVSVCVRFYVFKACVYLWAGVCLTFSALTSRVSSNIPTPPFIQQLPINVMNCVSMVSHILIIHLTSYKYFFLSRVYRFFFHYKVLPIYNVQYTV